MYECPSCSAGLEFNPKTQMLECKYCKNAFNPEDLEKLHLKDAKQEKGFSVTDSKDENGNEKADVYDAIVYRCTQCGAELITTDETIATFCSYCGSSAVLEKRNEKKTAPSYVIPFTKTKEECEQAYKNKIKQAFFAPSDMIATQQVEKIRGIYMPYWIYSFEKKGYQSDTGSKYSHRSGDYVYYDDYKITTNVNAFYTGITHDASANFSDTLSEAIAPFSVKDKKEFSPTYLSGFYADSEDVKSHEYANECSHITNRQASKELKKDKIYSKYNSNPSVNLKCSKAELGLFPVYFLATKNKTGDRVSYAVVNGQTGKVAAEIPIDYKKYVITSLLVAVPIFFLLNAFFTFTPGKVLVASIIFSIISLIISNKQLNEIYIRENNIKTDNYGKNKIRNASFSVSKYITLLLFALVIVINTFVLLKSITSFIVSATIVTLLFILPITLTIKKKGRKDQPKEKYSFKEKIKKIYKPIVALITAIIILIFNPVSDVYYYGGAVLSIIMTIWSFSDLVKQFNLLTTRKLPHLEKRGGDENE